MSEKPGTRALQNWLLAAIGEIPGVISVDSGIYVYRHIDNDPNKPLSVHSYGRALDAGVREDLPGYPNGKWPTSKIESPELDALIERLIERHEQLGIDYMIYAGRQWRPGSGWRAYRGTSPHNDHIHLEQTPAAARTLTAADITAILGDSTTTGSDTDPMAYLIYFINRTYEQYGRDPRKDPEGVDYWIQRAADEHQNQVWTPKLVSASPSLQLMTELLDS